VIRRAPYFILAARVEARWPFVYHNPARWTMTRDGYVPRAVFYLYVRALPRLRTGELLDTAAAVERGYASARLDGSKRFRLDWRNQQLREFAYPSADGESSEPNAEPEA
jgi:hypothetical protein